MFTFDADDKLFIAKEAATEKPAAVEHLISDMKMLAAYDCAAAWQEDGVMKKAFNAFSWDDPNVLKSLPKYLNSTGSQRARIDYAYNAICPRPADPTDSKQTMMELWMKARLFYYDSVYPFQFNPYSRRLQDEFLL